MVYTYLGLSQTCYYAISYIMALHTIIAGQIMAYVRVHQERINCCDPRAMQL